MPEPEAAPEAAPEAVASPVSVRRPRWPWWLAGGLALLLSLAAVVYFGLDPWLRRQLEKQVAEQSQGRYALSVGALRTRLTDGSVTISNARLRPTERFCPGPDSLPKLRLDVPLVRLTGISLLALWRSAPQRLDSLVIRSPRLRIDSLAGASSRPKQPLHARLPPRIPGLRLHRLVLRDAQALYRGRRRPRLLLERLDVTGRDFIIDSAGAADSARLFYAGAWQTRLRGGRILFSHHRAQVKQLDYDSRTGVVAIDSLRLHPTRIGRRGPVYLRMRIGRARLTGLTTARAAALPRHRFRADSLRLAGLFFDLTAPTTPPPPIHVSLRPVFRRLDLADARLTDAYVRLRGLEHAPVIRDLQLHGEHLRIDSAAFADPARVFYARAWEGRTAAASVPLDPPFYRVGYARVTFATRPGTLHFTNVLLQPMLSLTETCRRRGHEATNITLRVPELRADGADFGAFIRNKSLLIQTITFGRPRFFLDSDSRYPIGTKESIVTPESVRRLKFRLDLRRINIQDARLDFRYIGTTSSRYGRGHVTHLNGTITNATNDPRRMSAATPMVLRATALFQDRCRAQATAWLNLLDARGRHRLTGTFGAAPVQILNPILEPSALVTLNTGSVQRIDVAMQADRDGIRGELRGAYQNLHIRLLNDELDQTLWTKVKSKVANKIVIPDDNPDKPGRALRVGRTDSRRERRYSVFALWKQGIVSGALHSIGLRADKAKAMSETKTEPGG